jgi:hypothetical protein
VALRPLAERLWVAEAPLRYFVQMGRRMTVVALRSGDLLVHSPAPLDDDLRRALDELGPVRFVVPASSLHGHLSMGDYASAYPSAELFSAPFLAEKRPDLTFAAELGDEPDPRWADDLGQTVFRGPRGIEEVVFLHRDSRSLIVGDTCFNIDRDAPFLTRLWSFGPRLRARPGPTPLFRANVRDKDAARASVERILAWDFDRLVVGHGTIVETGGKEAFRQGWEWLG